MFVNFRMVNTVYKGVVVHDGDAVTSMMACLIVHLPNTARDEANVQHTVIAQCPGAELERDGFLRCVHCDIGTTCTNKFFRKVLSRSKGKQN